MYFTIGQHTQTRIKNLYTLSLGIRARELYINNSVLYAFNNKRVANTINLLCVTTYTITVR